MGVAGKRKLQKRRELQKRSRGMAREKLEEISGEEWTKCREEGSQKPEVAGEIAGSESLAGVAYCRIGYT